MTFLHSDENATDVLAVFKAIHTKKTDLRKRAEGRFFIQFSINVTAPLQAAICPVFAVPFDCAGGQLVAEVVLLIVRMSLYEMPVHDVLLG